ncbi:MAG TPA: hypothetical protein VHF86_04155, partial [Xanthomonadaceae bacterium]|nr:hypothetical protein [Xanthomonadaceae bacterium]
MTQPNRENARATMHDLLARMAAAGGSDLFIAHDFPPSMKSHGAMTPMADTPLTGEDTARYADALMNDKQRETPGTTMAKLHSISRANSSRCLSFI